MLVALKSHSFFRTMSGIEPACRLLPERKTDNLRLGRISAPEARYFVTFVTKQRRPWLAEAVARDALLSAWRDWHAESDGRVLAATAMPDHAHVLLQLGRRHTIGQLIGRWKAAVTRSCSGTASWQRDFWEHRVRDDENLEDYGLYILLNPYRGGQCAADEVWPGWWLPDENLFRFGACLGKGGLPQREWQGWGDDRFAGLKIGDP